MRPFIPNVGQPPEYQAYHTNRGGEWITIPVLCHECGDPLDDPDLVDLTMIRFSVPLCRDHFKIALTKMKAARV